MGQLPGSPRRKTFLFLMMPEDLGGHRVSGPASPWDSEYLRNLDGVNEAVRGATFLCRFASADQKHKVGVLTNFPSLRGDLYLAGLDFSVLVTSWLTKDRFLEIAHVPVHMLL